MSASATGALELPLGSLGAAGSPATAAAAPEDNGVDPSPSADSGYSFFPLLPYSYQAGVDLAGWFLKVNTSSNSGMQGEIKAVWDEETQGSVIEIQNQPRNPALDSAKKSLANPRHFLAHSTVVKAAATSGGSGAQFMFPTPRGGNYLPVDYMNIQGSTGMNNSMDASYTQRVGGFGFGSGAGSVENNANRWAREEGAPLTRPVNTRGEALQGSRNLPTSPVGALSNARSAATTKTKTALVSTPAAAGVQRSPSPDRQSNSPSRVSKKLSDAQSFAATGATGSGGGYTNPLDTFMEFPHPTQFIGSALPVLCLQIKNLDKYFSFEVEFEDVAGKLYKIVCSNHVTRVRLSLNSATLPLVLNSAHAVTQRDKRAAAAGEGASSSTKGGWNRIHLNLAQLAQLCFQATYLQVHRLRLYPSCRLRRVWLSDRAYPDALLPSFLRIFSEEFYQALREEKAAVLQWRLQQNEQQQAAASGEESQGVDQGLEEEHKESPSLPAGGALPPPPPTVSKLRAQLIAELARARDIEKALLPIDPATAATSALDSYVAKHSPRGDGENEGGGRNVPTAKSLRGLGNIDATGQNGQLFEYFLLSTQENRILARHALREESWARISQRTASQLGIPQQQLSMNKINEWRLRKEEQELLELSLPEDEKAKSHDWNGTLRNQGATYISIGNMFSGLSMKINRNKKKDVEVIRPIPVGFRG